MSSEDFPEFIGSYRVLRSIVKGGMSDIVEVEDASSGEHFALKWLNRGGRARKRFDREYKTMTLLDHPSVIKAHQYGIQDQRPWITMEMVNGREAQRYAKKLGSAGDTSRTENLLTVGRQMALGLEHVHQKGVIHRDLKSSNILVLPDKQVKLIDFGTAKIENAMTEITRPGEFVGTYAYASPEQLRGEDLTLHSDLYSLGVLFYRMFTGKFPFYGSGVYAIAKQHVETPPIPPTKLISELPSDLNNLIIQMLKKNPSQRPDSAGAIAKDLLEILTPGTEKNRGEKNWWRTIYQ